MSGLLGIFGGGRRDASFSQPMLTQVQLQAAGYGRAIPIVYGTQRVPALVIDYDDFVAIANPSTQGVGKGGGTITSVGYTYTVAVILALAEGPVVGIGVVWADKDRGSLSTFGFSLLTGARAQAAWGYMTTNHPSKALGYGGTALAVAGPLDLGGTGQLRNFSFEVQGVLYGAAAWAVQDAEPSAIVADILSNAFYGAGFPSSSLAALTAYQTYCRAAGFAMSPAIVEQRTAADFLREMLDATNAEAVYSQGILQVVPYGDVTITGNGATFVPVTTIAYALGVDELLPLGEDGQRVEVDRSRLQDTFNVMPVEFLDRAQDYNVSTVQDVEQVDADQYGQRQGPTFSCRGITRQDHALALSRLRAQRSIYVRNQYRFRLPMRFIPLDPMDLVTLTDALAGLSAEVVRVKEIRESADGALEVLAEEWPFGVGNASPYSTQVNGQTNPNAAIAPGNATAPYLADCPQGYSESGGPEVLIATSGGAFWGGCEVWVSGDGTTYSKAGVITNKARHGTLTALLASWASGVGVVDGTNTLKVSLAISGGTLVSVASAVAADQLNLCLVDGELMSFQTATLTGANAYDLTQLRRGAFDSQIASHASATKFMRLDDAVFRYPVPLARVGTTLYVKLRSFNIYGGGLEDLSGVPAYSIVPANTTPYPVTPARADQGDASRRLLGAPLGGGNLLFNSSFETDVDANGVADGWTAYNLSGGSEPTTLTLQAGGLFGGSYQRVAWSVNNTTVKGVYQSSATIVQGLQVGGVRGGWRASTSYVVSFYAKASSTNVGQFMRLAWTNDPSTTGGSVVALANPALTTAWQRYAFRVVWGATGSVEANGTLSLTISSAGLGVAATQGNLEFDGVQVEEGSVLTAYAPNAEDMATIAGYSADDPKFRMLQLLGNAGVGAASRGWYRGNDDASVKGGAPAIGTFTVTPQSWDTTLKAMVLQLSATATAASSNLDGMRYAKIELYRQSVAGTTATLTALQTFYVPLPDRLYQTPGTDGAAGNVPYVSHTHVEAGISAGVPAMKVTVYNVHGPSDTNCFYSPGGWAAGGALTNNGTGWPAGITGGTAGGSGGGGGGGGACPVPETLILLADGVEVPASRLCLGMAVWTQHESTLEWGAAPIEAVSHHTAACVRVGLEDGRELVASGAHRVFTRDCGWREIALLTKGDEILGARPGIVATVEDAGERPVVQIAIKGARTYQTAGLLSHNVKFL